MSSTIEAVKEYYGRVLTSSNDLKTTACCTLEVFTPSIAKIAAQIHPEVTAKYYGAFSDSSRSQKSYGA